MKYFDEETQTWKDIQVKVANAIQNEYGESNNDGYSQNYLNDKVVNVGTSVDNRSRVNVLKSKNLLDLQYLQLLPNSSGTITTNNTVYNVIIDTKNINSLYISGNFSLLADDVLRIGKYSSYPVVGSTGTRETKSSAGSIDTSSTNYVLFAFVKKDGELSTFAEAVKNSFMINEGSTALPYEHYVVPSIYVDNEEIYTPNETKNGYCTYYRVGKIVYGYINNGATTPTNGVLSTIPTELVPTQPYRIRTFYYNGSAYVSGQLLADKDTKKIYIYDNFGSIPSTATYIFAQIWWVID